MAAAPPLFVVGDVHGHRDALGGLLRDAGLVDGRERWTGADARLWLLGDLVDRGPDGIGAIELAMRLEREGSVGCLLGNHEVLMLATHRFPGFELDADGTTFRDVWARNGGRHEDLAGLADEHVAWLVRRPPLARVDDWLVVHADTDRYLELGGTASAITAAARGVLAGSEPADHAQLLDVVADRFAFSDPARLDRLLAALGGSRIVHGHTPIAIVTGADPATVTRPLVSVGGRGLNVDHCLFAGGPGFVTRLDSFA